MSREVLTALIVGSVVVVIISAFTVPWVGVLTGIAAFLVTGLAFDVIRQLRQ